jgi:hypothetical protein
LFKEGVYHPEPYLWAAFRFNTAPTILMSGEFLREDDDNAFRRFDSEVEATRAALETAEKRIAEAER